MKRDNALKWVVRCLAHTTKVVYGDHYSATTQQ